MNCSGVSSFRCVYGQSCESPYFKWSLCPYADPAFSHSVLLACLPYHLILTTSLSSCCLCSLRLSFLLESVFPQ